MLAPSERSKSPFRLIQKAGQEVQNLVKSFSNARKLQTIKPDTSQVSSVPSHSVAQRRDSSKYLINEQQEGPCTAQSINQKL